MGKIFRILSACAVGIIGTYIFMSNPIGKVDNEALVTQYKIKEKKKLASMAYAESQSDSYGLNVRNAPRPLYTPTYDGSNQAVHPKVLYFKNGWNGYKYWMGLTPYPFSNDDYENPQILVSNDGIKFRSPKKNNKPLFVPEDVAKGGHYSDIHMCMVNDTLEVYFRYNPAKTEKNQPDNNKNYIYVTKSKDGLHWTDKKLVLNNDTFKVKCAYLSPIINYENGKYKVWFTNYDGELYYTETTDWNSFSELKKCNFVGKGNKLKIWHQDLIKTDVGYEFVCCAYGEVFLNQNLYYACSEDGINFKPLKKIMEPTDKAGTFDEKTLYRPCLLKKDGQYLLYYSAMDSKLKWRIGVIKDAKGINIVDKEYDKYISGEIDIDKNIKKNDKKINNHNINIINNKNINNKNIKNNKDIKDKNPNMNNNVVNNPKANVIKPNNKNIKVVNPKQNKKHDPKINNNLNKEVINKEEKNKEEKNTINKELPNNKNVPNGIESNNVEIR
ncbi:hypothetical protein Z969_10865 [Clostridium novyi A str. 4570]|uniref:Glycosyl hydrolase family 32 N-terminal domain-containing protein n=1 Tax=Clostridium novyi A str. 4570 TaxID=1444290 RepID=A0AA88ZMM6_CLONO|nr:hypothetical protein [Clostridium novyi]KGM98965.1 hypothetical protein Z969_10865 [Clostridium novyi A str. 4570]